MEKLQIPDQFRDTPSVAEKLADNVAQIGQDLELSAPHLLFYLVGLLRRAKVVEKGTVQLLTSLMTISGDEHLVEKVAMTEPFPAEFEAEYICHAVGELRQRSDRLEEWRDARLAEGGETAAVAARVARRGRTQAQVRSIFESIVRRAVGQVEGGDERDHTIEHFSPPLLEETCPEKTNTAEDEKLKNEDPVCSMYKDMCIHDVHNSITDEVQQMKKDYHTISANHQQIRATYLALKGQMSWNLLCKCFEEVAKMKNAIDQMTEGNLEYVEPQQLTILVNKLKFVEDNLLEMDDALHEIPRQCCLDMISSSCVIVHYIEDLELREDITQQDIALAREISERTKDLKVILEYCSELISDMIAQLARRMLLLWRLETKLEMLIEIKADKEYFFHIIDDKADKILVKELVTDCLLDKEYQKICHKLCDYLLMIMKKMMVWIETLKIFQKEVDCTIEEDELESIEKKLLSRLKYLKDQVNDFEEGYKNYRKQSNKVDMRPFKDLSCFADNMPAVMYNKRDAGLPILKATPPRRHIGPEIAFKLCQLRGTEQWEFKKNKPCVEKECPRDFEEQLVCPTCLGQTNAPCKKLKRKPRGDVAYVDITYADLDDEIDESTEEDEDMSDEDQDKKKDAEAVTSSIVKDILKGIF